MKLTYASLLFWIGLAFAYVLFAGEISIDLQNAMIRPGSGYWMGTDALGRPVATLIWGGAYTALKISFISVLLAGMIGVVLGAYAGIRGGWFDQLLMRTIDILLAFPGILLAIAITAVLGPKVENIILALTLLGWTGFARLARGQTLVLRQESFVLSARTVGVSTLHLLRIHIIPNLLAPVLVQASFGMAGAILAESSLSFLGLGDPTQPSWGALLSDGVGYLRSAPYLSIFPGAAIFLVVLSLNLAGDALTERLQKD